MLRGKCLQIKGELFLKMQAKVNLLGANKNNSEV